MTANHYLTPAEQTQVATKYKTLDAKILKRNLEQSGWNAATVDGTPAIHRSLNAKAV